MASCLVALQAYGKGSRTGTNAYSASAARAAASPAARLVSYLGLSNHALCSPACHSPAAHALHASSSSTASGSAPWRKPHPPPASAPFRCSHAHAEVGCLRGPPVRQRLMELDGLVSARS